MEQPDNTTVRTSFYCWSPSFVPGTCDLCHRRNRPVGEGRLSKHGRWYIVCDDCVKHSANARSSAVRLRILRSVSVGPVSVVAMDPAPNEVADDAAKDVQDQVGQPN